MFLYTDLEANGLNPDTIWVVCVNDLVFTDRERFAEFVEASKEATWVFHNGIGFDIPVLAKVWNIRLPKEKVVDTLVLGRLADPNRDGGHSLRAYGNTLGFEKGDHTDWSRLSDEMITYCLRDVAVTKATHEYLINDKLKGFSQESIDLEHQVAWIIAKQERNGWLLDQEKCSLLLCKLKERQIELERHVLQTFVPRANFVRVVEPKFTKDGHLSKVGLGHLGDSWRTASGTHSRIDWPELNLGSRQQIGKYLQAFGWKPKIFTETGQPKVDEKTLEGVEVPEAQLIAEYLMIQKRLAMVKSWIDAVDPEDDRVHGKVNPNGAVTGRMTHNSPNMAQVTANGKPYGEECRECWTVPRGYKLVGADASGLELRMLAHYMKDDEYTKEILGGDVHSANQRAAGLETRNQAKTFIYAFL